MTYSSPSARVRRVLVVDDEAQVLDAYRRVLNAVAKGDAASESEFDALSAEIFGAPASGSEAAPFLDEVVYCRQGEEAVQTVEAALASGRPFALVFLDMRMPPGIDGLETAQRIRSIDPQVNIVIVTGYSDHKPAEITAAVGRPEKLFYLVKPFDAGELQQLTQALVSRWSSDVDAAQELARRVAELELMNAALQSSEARAREAARRDALTGLSNRTGLTERFQREAAGAEALECQLSVLYLDLDRFKDVNDSLGHAAGDEFIREFARRLKDATGEDGFAARLGGDEFAVICTDVSKVPRLSERLLAAGAAPYAIDNHVVHTSVSIGIGHCDAGRPNLVEAMRRADIALYAAKAAGRGVISEFDRSMERDILSTQRLAQDLARAIANDDLTLHYQPIVQAEGTPICGVEALLRWRHPTQGMIPPLVFIAVAEKTDLIRDLGDWVVRRAFTDASAWPDLVTSINLSPIQLRAPGFVEKVSNLVSELAVDPTMFEFEITETVLLHDVANAAAQIRALKSMGFRIALDDFGSGYAGIAYLKQIPFDRLKIDRSFVQDLSMRAGAGGVVKSIIALAQAMGLSITAEGVEDIEQHQFLKDAGCSQMQGFLFHQPKPRESILELRTGSQHLRMSA
jgi:diguanylate cyclase (GGDEF)-like protein